MSDRNHFSGDSKPSGPQLDEPPNSRLFIVGSKKLTENEFRDAFSRFGDIEDVWMVRDRRTGESKGVTYIKYAKTSEAATAYEAMNGKTMQGSDRQIKVMIASSRNKGSQREENEDEKIQRLFIVAPKTMTETDLETHFKMYGDIDYVNIVRDKETRESKGFAYIKYYKFSHAARAFEECDRKYKAVFSEPRKPSMKRYANAEFSERSVVGHPNSELFSFSDKCYRLMVIGSPYLTEDQLWKLCNIIPGLEYAHLRIETAKRRAIGTVVYSSKQWATYAAEKLHGFEYPTGSRLIVKPDGTVPRIDSPRSAGNSRLSGSDTPTNILQLAETIAHATSIIQNAGFQVGSSKVNSFDLSETAEMCSVRLPSPQPLASIDAETQARCFIVCTPPAPSTSILRDIFCRFGNLIEVYLLANKNCGYAKYATAESAKEAIKVLHGADVCGGRIKVIKAEERSEQSRKRQRLDET